MAYPQGNNYGVPDGMSDNFDLMTGSYIREMLEMSYPNMAFNSLVPFCRASQYNYNGQGNTETVSLIGWMTLCVASGESIQVQVINDKNEVVPLNFSDVLGNTKQFTYFGVVSNVYLSNEGGQSSWSFNGWKVNQNQSQPLGQPPVLSPQYVQVQKNLMSHWFGGAYNPLYQIISDGVHSVSIVGDKVYPPYGSDRCSFSIIIQSLGVGTSFEEQYPFIVGASHDYVVVPYVSPAVGQAWKLNVNVYGLNSSNQLFSPQALYMMDTEYSLGDAISCANNIVPPGGIFHTEVRRNHKCGVFSAADGANVTGNFGIHGTGGTPFAGPFLPVSFLAGTTTVADAALTFTDGSCPAIYDGCSIVEDF